MFQSNPEHVMSTCQTNDELREFIQEFCAIMGEHFTTLADQQDKVTLVIFYEVIKKFHIQNHLVTFSIIDIVV